MVFASAAARTSAIASPQEGMISYLKDTNSTEYYSGSAWVAIGAASGGMTLLSTTTLSGASTTISTISTSYNQLIAYIYGVSNASSNYQFFIRPNGTTNLAYAILPQNQNNTAQQDKLTNADISCAANITQTGAHSTVLVIDNYAQTSAFKPFTYHGFAVTTGGDLGFAVLGGIKDNSAITSLTFVANAGTFNAGTVLLYGVK
jgi:hypothetical protein